VLGTIYRSAQNKITNPSHLKTLIVDYLDKENWSAAGADINGDAYEELLERSAGDTKTTAGQYFTPRPLINAIVDVVQPTVADRVVDPACGSGGFLLAAYAHATRDATALTPPERDHLRTTFVRGVDIGATTSRLASMNLLLHGLGSITGDSLVDQKDALIADPGERRRPRQPAVRAQLQHRHWKWKRRRYGDLPPGLRRHDVQQAAELPAAHHDHPRHQRARRSGVAGQRAFRGWSRRDAAP
jgi:hypothetical protein